MAADIAGTPLLADLVEDAAKECGDAPSQRKEGACATPMSRLDLDARRLAIEKLKLELNADEANLHDILITTATSPIVIPDDDQEPIDTDVAISTQPCDVEAGAVADVQPHNNDGCSSTSPAHICPARAHSIGSTACSV